MNQQLLFAVCILALGTSNALASAVIVKQRAKEIARPGSTTPPPKAPASGPGVPAAPAANAAQQQAVSKLKADIAVIKSKKEVTPELKAQLKKDLAAATDGATKPAAETLAKLGDDLASALVDKKISSQDVADLATSLAAVLNSAGISTVEIATAVRTTKEILTASGVTKQDIAAVADDLKAIVGELQKGGPKAAGK